MICQSVIFNFFILYFFAICSGVCSSFFFPFPNFFCIVVVSFLITGLITLSNNGVAAAEAVATTAIAAVVLTWFVEGKNFSTVVVDSYNTTHCPFCISCPVTLSSPFWVKSPTLGWLGAGQGTSSLPPTPLVSGGVGGSTSGGGATGGGGVSLVVLYLMVSTKLQRHRLTKCYYLFDLS